MKCLNQMTVPSQRSLIERPRTFAEVQDLATIMASSDAVPKSYQKKPADIFVAIGMGDSLGINPFQALQGIAVINGIPAVYGDLAKALVLETPNLDYFKEWSVQQVEKEGKGHCEIRIKGNDPVIVEFTLEMATKAGLTSKPGPWQQYRARMLQMKARAWCMRDAAPGALKGLKIVEEVMDYNYGTPVVEDLMPKRLEKTEAVKGQLEQPIVEKKAVETITAEQARDLALESEASNLVQNQLLVHIAEEYSIRYLYELPANKFLELFAWIGSQKK